MDLDTLPLFSKINLKRKAHLRDSKQLLNVKDCCHLLIWRGKLLFRFNDGKPVPYLIEKRTKFIKILSNYIFVGEFDNKYIVYEIIYNGTPDIFLKSMSEEKFNFDIREKDWILK